MVFGYLAAVELLRPLPRPPLERGLVGAAVLPLHEHGHMVMMRELRVHILAYCVHLEFVSGLPPVGHTVGAGAAPVAPPPPNAVTAVMHKDAANS